MAFPEISFVCGNDGTVAKVAMSFGYGVGDFIAVLRVANNVRERFVNAPRQFKAISDEFQSLSIVLQNLEVVLPQQQLTSQQKTELDKIVQGCHNVLEGLQKRLPNYEELSPGEKSFGRKFRRLFQRLKWNEKDISELRDRIVSNCTMCGTFREQINSMIKERETIIDWLNAVDYGPQQSDFISRRQEGTGQWLLDSNEFQGWMAQKNQTLFCPGIPGAGKTILTSIVIDYLETKFQSDGGVRVTYIYFNFRQQHMQRPVNLLASILKQLLQQEHSISEDVRDLYKRHRDRRTRPSFEEISKTLRSTLTSYRKAFIVIDALDECQASDGDDTDFLTEILHVQAKTGANLFVTSRFIPEIEREFKGSISLEIRASDEDVRKYLDSHISRLPPFILRSPELQEKIKTEINKAVDGMFLLAQLHLDSLVDKISLTDLERALDMLPKGSDAYDQAYEEAMARIFSQRKGFQNLAVRALSWIIYAKRPLATLELRHALAVTIAASAFDRNNLTDIELVVSVCAGLVTVDEESSIVRLVHYTMQDYFERNGNLWFCNAQANIAEVCVTYLSFNDFEIGVCSTDEKFEARLQSYVLYDYAARNWGYHAHAASGGTVKLFVEFLTSQAKISSCSQAMLVSEGYSGYSQSFPKQMTGLHLAAYFGLKEAMAILLENGQDPNVESSNGWTPLLWAAHSGHEPAVKLLLEKGAEPEHRNLYDQTAVLLAAEHGHERVVKLLVEKGADLGSRNSYNPTPLSLAVQHGHEPVVRLLLEKRADLGSMDRYGQSLLSLAAENGHDSVVKLLLENGAKLESVWIAAIEQLLPPPHKCSRGKDCPKYRKQQRKIAQIAKNFPHEYIDQILQEQQC